MPKRENKLRARYNRKQKDTIVFYPLGINTKADSNYLIGELLKIRIELERRGYDWQTMKFEISVKLPNLERFPTLSKNIE